MKSIFIIILLSINLGAQIKDQITILILTDTTNLESKQLETEEKIYLNKIELIHYIESEDYDSLYLFIKDYDSIAPDSNKWIDDRERFFIELFIGNMDFISNAKNYHTYLGLRDTVDTYRSGTYKLLYHEPRIIDSSNFPILKINLLDFLLVSFRDRAKSLKEKHFGYEYVWDFLDFIYNEELNTYDILNNKATDYYKHYPDSPLLNYIRYNFIIKEKQTKRGMKFGVGYGWFGYDSKSKNLFKPRGNLSIWIDTYWSGFHIAFAMYRGYSLQIKSDILIDNKIIPKGSKLYQGIQSLTTGYLFRVNPNFEITPYAGIAQTETEKDDDANLKTLYSLQVGIKSDYVIETHEESGWVVAGNLMLRIEFGIIFNNYGKIRQDLGGSSYYLTLGILFSAYRTKYDYSF